MKIEIWSDFACPFCYIGKRRFEQAFEEFEHKDEFEVVYKSFILDPNAPRETSLSGVEELAKSKGIEVSRAKAMYDNVLKMAATEDLHYNLDIMKATNTFDAHRLMQWAKTQYKEKELIELLYNGYFITGKNLSDFDDLLEISEKVGLDVLKAEEVLELGLYKDEVLKDISDASNIGVSSVPTFVFEREFGISGAQKKEFFIKALEDAYKNNKKIKINADNTACSTDGCDF